MTHSIDSVESIVSMLKFLNCNSSFDSSEADLGVHVYQGRIQDQELIVIASNPSPKLSAIGVRECNVIQSSLELAGQKRIPIVFLWSTAGARLSEGAVGLGEIAKLLKFAVAPRDFIMISIVLGATAGIGSYLTVLSEFSLMLKGSQLFMTGPKVVQELTGKVESKDEVGGYQIHERSGIPTRICADLIELKRDLQDLFKTLFSEEIAGEFSYKDYFGGSIELRLRRISGRVCGEIVLNERLGDPSGSEVRKLNMFLRVCSALQLPLVTYIDTRGIKPGSAEEESGSLLHGAELMRLMGAYPALRIAVITGGSIAAIHLALGVLNFSADYVIATAETDISPITKSARGAFSDAKPQTPSDLLRNGLVSEVVSDGNLALKIEALLRNERDLGLPRPGTKD